MERQTYANAHQSQKKNSNLSGLNRVTHAHTRTRVNNKLNTVNNNNNTNNNNNNNNIGNDNTDNTDNKIAINKVPSSGIATVKGVMSGDTVILTVPATVRGQPSAEKTVTLSGIQAPRCGRGKNGVDEPYAWEAREHLRKIVIGKRVQYNISYTTKSNKEFGTVLLEGKRLAEIMVAAGWADVATSTARKDGSIHPERQALMDLKAIAEGNNIGIWNKEKSSHDNIRHLDWNVESRARSFFDANKGAVLVAIVDKVLDGSTVRLEVMTDRPLHHIMVNLHLAGVQCPKIPHNDNDNVPPFALAAKLFVEVRLLHHEVGLILQGIDKFGNFFGSLQFAKGNITVELLRNGLGKYVSWSGALTPINETLRKTEFEAKKNRYNIWRHESTITKPNSLENGTNNHFSGKCVQIISGDTLMIDVNGKARKVILSSVLAPRMGFARRNEAPEPWAPEAKEFLRKRLIGKRVKLLVEYTRSAPPTAHDQTSRVYASIYQGKSNVAEILVSSGLASVVRHRPDEPRSIHYEQLLQAEERAIKNKKGIHGKNPPRPHPIVDLTERFRPESNTRDAKEKSERQQRLIVAKAKQYLPFLQKEHDLRGIVEFCFSGSRLKIFIPTQHCYIAFILAGVRTPLGARGNNPKEAYSDEATSFTRELCMQQDVRLTIETMDKGCNYIGNLYIGGRNLALALVENGLGSVYETFRERQNEELEEAQQRAKASKLNIWKNWTPPKVNETTNDTNTQENIEDATEVLLNVKITEVVDAGNFYVHIVGNKAVETIENEMKIFGETAESLPILTQVKKGYICAGLFNDGSWYRIRIDGKEGEYYQVSFIDYGNVDMLPLSSMRALTNPVLQNAAPAAKSCNLAALKVPPLHDENYEISAQQFYDLVWDKPLLCKVHLREGTNRLHVTLHLKDTPESINVQLLKAGLIRIKRRPHRKLQNLVNDLRAHESEAQDKRLGIWEYGIVSDPEEVDNDSMFRI